MEDQVHVPAPEATMVAAMGNNCAAVMRSNECWCDCDMSKKGNETVTAAATTASTIQHTQANVTLQGPQYGQHRRIQLSTNVAKPMGTVLRNRLLVGSAIMTAQISG